ncbi:Uncharacterized protein APZ42_007755 [Daphnia magna]|uniref:Uncharacterized protein n=1 Tax=Daphnia magna TaxID=35525 RepID=A0A164F3S4_9CRUS|nr:Uncharacterized protein APZ42_007755 [Daphnia magna]
MWQKTISVIEKFLPPIREHELYMYLIARRSRDTKMQLNAIKTIHEAIKWLGLCALSNPFGGWQSSCKSTSSPLTVS